MQGPRKKKLENSLKNSKALETTLLKTLISSAFCCYYLLSSSRKDSFFPTSPIVASLPPREFQLLSWLSPPFPAGRLDRESANAVLSYQKFPIHLLIHHR